MVVTVSKWDISISQYMKHGNALIPCFRCGVCCMRYEVSLSVVEARRIADGLGITWGEFLDRYVDQRWPSAESFLLRQRNLACIFLEHTEGTNKTSCLIHSFKPSACREWMPSLYRRECREGLNRYWGLTVDLSGELQGPRERIRCFESVVESLMVAGGSDAHL